MTATRMHARSPKLIGPTGRESCVYIFVKSKTGSWSLLVKSLGPSSACTTRLSIRFNATYAMAVQTEYVHMIYQHMYVSVLSCTTLQVALWIC